MLRRAATGLVAAALTGCPTDSDSGPADGTKTGDALGPSEPTVAAPPEDFRRDAHQKALVALREHAKALLPQLDPVAAAEVTGSPLRPPSFGAAARAKLREALDPARREAEGIKPGLLSPEDGMVLRAIVWASDRAWRRLTRPPWRDDPRAVLHALQPYVDAVDRRLAAGECADGCGIEQLAPALEAGMREVGSASVPTLAAAGDDLRMLVATIGRWAKDRPDDDPFVTAHAAIDALVTRLEGELSAGASTLAAAPEQPWSKPLPRAAIAQWARRPDRWGRQRLRAWLESEEAHGGEPSVVFGKALSTLARLNAMEARGPKATVDPPTPSPVDAAACEAIWAPLAAWAKGQPSLTATFDCRAQLAALPPDTVSDASFVLHVIDHGIVDPTRRARVEQAADDIAMLRGRAASEAQRSMMLIAVTAGAKIRPDAQTLALQQSQHRMCQAAAAVWVHGELGDDAQLRARLGSYDCGDVAALVESALARPRVALTGLGLILIGTGPADAAALDHYWWAPMGMVRDLALPPAAPPDAVLDTKIEELSPTPTP